MKKNLFRKFLALFLTGTLLAGVGCKDYDDDIKEINNKIEGLETGKLASLEEQLNSLKVTISTLEQADKDLQQKINEQEKAISSATGDIEQLEKELEKAVKAHESLQTNIDNLKKYCDGAFLKTADAAKTYATIASVADAVALAKNLKVYNTDAAIKKAIDDAVAAAVNANGAAFQAAFDTRFTSALDAALSSEAGKEGKIYQAITAAISQYDGKMHQCLTDALAENGVITNAIADAFNYIRLGKANAIVTGGAEAAIAAPGLGGFNAMNALSTRNESPETASRPFSASRDGFVMGEGAACLILEEMEHALARGAKIYGEIVGAGMSADAYHLTASHPEGLGAKLVMKNALEDAEMKPEEIDYINVHGTSTPVGDISEAKAILDVFGEHAYKLNISSTKSMTGHLLGAAGALEAIACIMAVNEDIVPPTINHEEGDNDPEIDYNLNFTFNKAQKRTVNAALSNTFGFGGHNASMIVKKFVK